MLVGEVTATPMPASSRCRITGRAGASRQQGCRRQAVSASGLPYTIYYGNLHSQTNHSDGGGDLGTCVSEQAPQSAA